MSKDMLLIILAITWLGLGVWYFKARRPLSGIPLFLSMMVTGAFVSIITKGIIHN